MIEYFAVYRTDDGSMQWKSNGPTGVARAQKVPEGMAVLEMPFDAFVALPGNLDPLKIAVQALVNFGAGEFRKRFITDIAGQQAVYLAKEAEARAWTSGGDPATAPYLAAEATATGKPIDDVAASVIATADRWRTLDPKIEATRRAANVAVDAATNIAQIVDAAKIDWASLNSQP